MVSATERHRCGQLALLILVVVAFIAGPLQAPHPPKPKDVPPGSGPHEFCIYVLSKGTLPSGNKTPGHASIQLIPKDGPQKGNRTLAWGQYPNGSGKKGAPKNTFSGAPGSGQLKQDHLRPWEWKVCYEVSASEYNELAYRTRRAIDADHRGKLEYHLFSENCLDFAETYLPIIGKSSTFPDTEWRSNISDPSTLADELEDIGHGGTTSGGGTVTKSPGPGTTISGGPDPQPVPVVNPDRCSYSAIGNASIAEPVQTASSLCLEPHTDTLPEEELAVDQTLNLTLQNADSSNSVILTQWGDGAIGGASTKQNHSYSQTGEFTIRTAVVDTGALHRFEIPVDVTNTMGDGSATVHVPSPPPSKPCPQGAPTTGEPPAQCHDGRDNDGDSDTDYPADPGCSGEDDDSESPNPACSDGQDNDGDGHTDYPDDSDCDSERDDSESGGGNGGGGGTVGGAVVADPLPLLIAVGLSGAGATGIVTLWSRRRD